MSRQTVRSAIASFFTPATVTNLAAIHAYPAKVTNEGEFVLPSGSGWGAVVFVQLGPQKEKRIALGGPASGIKWRTYQAILICIYRSSDPKSEDVGLACDQFLDSVVARLQSDRKIGSTVVFQAGEGNETGGDDIEVDASLPRTLHGGVTQVFATVRFQVAEMLYA